MNAQHTTVTAWHFVGKTLRNGEPIPADGETLRYDGPLKMCVSGLHASERIIDALQYAPGDTICLVECGGEIVMGGDKFICRERTILWRVNGERLLRKFARKQALSVIHLWDAPDVVRQFLETGDDKLRDAAMKATRTVAGLAAWDTAWAVAWDAARAVDQSLARAFDAAPGNGHMPRAGRNG